MQKARALALAFHPCVLVRGHGAICFILIRLLVLLRECVPGWRMTTRTSTRLHPCNLAQFLTFKPRYHASRTSFLSSGPFRSGLACYKAQLPTDPRIWQATPSSGLSTCLAETSEWRPSASWACRRGIYLWLEQSLDLAKVFFSRRLYSKMAWNCNFRVLGPP